MPIPKVIHYCWFGDKPIPKEYSNYISGWKRMCPDYEIIKWDLSNYDYTKSEYTKHAFENKKWAFLSDYARIDIIYQYGGIYLDVDVELLKGFDEFLNDFAFFGIEKDFDRQLYISTGLGFGSEKNNPILKDILSEYDTNILKNDPFAPCPILQRPIFEQYGFVQKNRIQKLDNLTIYPMEYFAPMDSFGKLRVTKKTVSIHHYAALWQDGKGGNTLLFRRCVNLFGRKNGEYIYQIIKRIKRR